MADKAGSLGPGIVRMQDFAVLTAVEDRTPSSGWMSSRMETKRSRRVTAPPPVQCITDEIGRISSPVAEARQGCQRRCLSVK